MTQRKLSTVAGGDIFSRSTTPKEIAHIRELSDGQITEVENTLAEKSHRAISSSQAKNLYQYQKQGQGNQVKTKSTEMAQSPIDSSPMQKIVNQRKQ